MTGFREMCLRSVRGCRRLDKAKNGSDREWSSGNKIAAGECSNKTGRNSELVFQEAYNKKKTARLVVSETPSPS